MIARRTAAKRMKPRVGFAILGLHSGRIIRPEISRWVAERISLILKQHRIPHRIARVRLTELPKRRRGK